MADFDESVQKSKRVLLMLSGGRDSFLSACHLIEEGYYVQMITYDNGCMSDTDAVQKVAERIIKKCGSEHASYVGVRGISVGVFRLQKAFLYSTIDQINKLYPKLRPAQLPCLACHTSMYLESIAYCKAHNIHYMAEGARESQKFFVELPDMVERYKELSAKNGIELILPVYKLQDDWERKLELADRGYVPKTQEPQCWIGCPLGKELDSDEIRSLAKYYDEEMKPQLQGLIDGKVKIYRFKEEDDREEYVEF